MTHCELFKQTLDTIGITYDLRMDGEGYTYIFFGDEFFEFNPDGSLASHP